MSLYLGDQIISGQTTLVGESRNIGQIIPSAIPLTDAGLHLLDGALIQGGGIYSAFVDYIASIVSTYPSVFTTESAWQSSVTTYGVCGKFVYDSTNNTVRLPKYNSKIYTGGGTAPVVGNGTTLGWTDGTHNGGSVLASAGYGLYASGGYNITVGVTTNENASTMDTSKAVGITTDPTKSGIIAQLSNITTSLDGYYYIVIATSTKTDIIVDIDEIATDLNGKADTDLTNVPSSKGILTESYINGTSWYRIYSDGWCEQGGATSVGADAPITVTLLKAYTNNLYSVQITINGTASSPNANNYPYQALGKTASSFIVANYNSGPGANNYYQWQACGYIR